MTKKYILFCVYVNFVILKTNRNNLIVLCKIIEDFIMALYKYPSLYSLENGTPQGRVCCPLLFIIIDKPKKEVSVSNREHEPK